MGLLAVGAYLKAVRGATPRSEVAYKSGTSESQIVRLEAGDLDTRFSLFFAVCRYVGADLYDVDELLANELATEQDGVTLAHKALARSAETDRTSQVDPTTDIVALLRRLADLVSRGAPLDVALSAVASEQAKASQAAKPQETQARRRRRQ